MIHTTLDNDPVISSTTISPVRLDELLKQDTQIDLIDMKTSLEYREAHVEFARSVPDDSQTQHN